MLFSLIHIVLAAFGLGFLIFIHELGHYWMARRAGMTVEIFSIGFGKPFYSWEHKGVKWQFCWLPFGGYVRIAGMEKKGNLEPYEIPDGFYGKKPLARIKVAAMGPLVNLVFAFLAFCILWLSGGRNKSFSEYTHLIGWVDGCSDLYDAGVRAGDQVNELNNKPYNSFQDVIYATMLDDMNPTISGFKINYFLGEKTPFKYVFPMQPTLKGVERVSSVVGTFNPAEFLIYVGGDNLPAGSPMVNSGIKNKDRLIWVDGKLIFSRKELIATINEPKALLTVRRGQETFLVRVPRVKISDLRMSPLQRSEMEDWQHEADLKGKVQELFFIPYLISDSLVINAPLSYLNADSREVRPCERDRAEAETPLIPLDQILAVDGLPVQSSFELLKYLQTRHIQMIVQNENDIAPVSWKEADQRFVNGVDWNDVGKMVCSIGTGQPISEMGKLRLLCPIEPKVMSDFPLPEPMRNRIASEIKAQKKAIEDIDNPDQKQVALRQLEESQKRVMLGISLQDMPVKYNPGPFTLFANVFKETWRTLIALVTGILSPKWLAGPVGMVQVMHQSWSVGVKEALYWLAVISMNLGILNFLPIPVLDGGHICFSLWEAITKKPIKAKTMERLIIPFILLLIALFVYLTYHDIVRLISRFF